MIFFLVDDTLGNSGVSPKIVNAINHNLKNKNRKMDFSFVSAHLRIFHENLTNSETLGPVRSKDMQTHPVCIFLLGTGPKSIV